MDGQVSIRFLGQAGYWISGGGTRVLIDPYLSDSAGKPDKRFSRQTPIPVKAQELKADIYLVTHDHLDHLDPETVQAFGVKGETEFIAPRLAARHLAELGVRREKLHVINALEEETVCGVKIRGIFALGTEKNVADTTGYRLEFPGGKSVYHSSDTAFCSLLLESAEPADVLLVCINGKYGNLSAEQAVLLAQRVGPRFAIPNHYDVMALNSENPQVFRYLYEQAGLKGECVIMDTQTPLVF